MVAPLEMEDTLRRKNLCREGACRRGRKREIPAVDPRGRGQMLTCVFVREDSRACRVQPFVVIGMIEVPMGVDEVRDGAGIVGGRAI